MGHKLVAEAFAFVAAHNERARGDNDVRPLEPLAVSLLVFMAHCARDNDDEPVYFAGRDVTCSALGLPTTEVARRRLMRATTALIGAGVISRAKKGHRGSTTVYRLNRQGVSLAVPNQEERVSPDTTLSGNAYHQTTEYLPPDDGMGTTRGTPYIEIQERQGGDARANAFELAEPPTEHPTHWDFDLPEPRTAREAARCEQHPTGTNGKCWACGDNRRAWEQTHPNAPARPRPEHRYDCSKGRHRVIGEKAPGIPDDICATCLKAGVVDAYAPTPIGATA